MVAFIFASRSYDSRVISASRLPTRRAGMMKTGSNASDSTVICQDTTLSGPTSAPRSQASAVTSIYTDDEVVAKFPFMDVLLKSIETAQPRPVAVKYGDVSLAIQDALYAIEGGSDTGAALSQLQTKLETLVQ